MKITSRASPLRPNASAVTCLAMYDGVEQSVVRVGLGRVITDKLWGKSTVRDTFSIRITSVHSHTPVPTLTFPSLILSDILGTWLCVIEAKKEKWDMKCQLFEFDCVRHSVLIKQVSTHSFSFYFFDKLDIVICLSY